MSEKHTHPGIVVGVDGSPSSTTAVQWAIRDAELRNVPIKLVHVVAPMVTAGVGSLDIAASAEYVRLQQEQAQQIVEQAHKVATEAASPGRAPNVTSEVLHARVVPALVEVSEQADMLVVGCRGYGAVSQALLGSVGSGLTHHAHCPVAVIHDESPLTAHSAQAPVVVGIDGSPTSELATEIAFDEASRRGVELVALHAWSDMGPLGFPSTNWAPIEWRNIEDQEKEVLAERLCGWQEQYPDVVVHKVVVCDRPAFRLFEQTQKAQLVVVGSHGRGGFPGMLLGSVSTAVVNAARIPVIIARMAPSQMRHN
ncbi:universal stress protein [Mycobacterium sp.]|uniref:universal stress protein n=1 Tax=Mycobacterium sp. TaxID=1785 RepID=UPI002C163E0C|nr:universal stress protein [Mycobacterium sp.]HTQ17721.1 universal stress protein [Mycobacterium sp.]